MKDSKDKKQKAEKRLDLRKKFIFTCDPVTARDYDDALSLETNLKGQRILGVHIADVSHFVKPGSDLDRRAFERGTSVFYVDHVEPMLPEELANGECSLLPGVDRLTFSVFMTFDKAGKLVKRSFAKSVIRSKARFTYEQVMGVIAGSEKVKRKSEKVGGGSIAKKELKTIREISKLAQQLRAQRFAAGALDLEMPEPEVLLDENGCMTGLVTRPYDESHQMIEECMIAANEAVATELWTHGVRILARLHDSPEDEKLLTLRAELRGLGVKMGNIANPKVFSQFLKAIKSHPLYSTISMMVLRSMKKAVYDPRRIGHFGLAKKYYAHFTSPIRRYPDLTLHRQLADYLAGGAEKAKRPPKLLAKWAEHSSEKEIEAQEAERASVEEKKYEFLADQLASRQILEYDAVISKCMPFGCFVEIPEIAVSGLVHISLLSRKYVRYNESDGTLSAYGGGNWKIGDRLRVTVAAVDFQNRRIDFTPVRQPKSPRGTRRH